MPVDFKQYISELQQAVTFAGLNREIWWLYEGEHTRPDIADALNAYPAFFKASIHAHFVALVVVLYRLYETRPDTYNISRLLKKLRADRRLDCGTLDSLNLMVDEAKPLWIKISQLRNKVFGHRSVKFSVAEVFEEANVTPNDIHNLVKKSERLVNELSRALDRSVHAFNLGAGDDLKALLAHIQYQTRRRNTN
jgi:hypothetical protein